VWNEFGIQGAVTGDMKLLMTILFLTGTFACAETVQRSESEQFRPDDQWFAQMAERDGQRLRQIRHETDGEPAILSHRQSPSTLAVTSKAVASDGPAVVAIAAKRVDDQTLLVRSLRK
jgi:hypothetical protein